MGKVLAIALNTFRETVRDKILYTLLVFAFAMIGSAAVLEAIGAAALANATVRLAMLRE